MRLVLFAALLAMSCRYDLESHEEGSQCEDLTVPVCQEADNHSDYQWLQENIFNTNCSGDSCHNAPKNGKAPLGKITLVDGAAYDALLGPSGMGVESDIEAGRKLVQPGFPDDSYLLFLLHGIDPALSDARPFNEPPSDVGYMPRQNDTLCCQKIEAVRRWIEAGALP